MKKPPPRVTLIEVANRAGVSPATVSNAVNGARYVDSETKKRIDKVIAELGYMPNIRARRLRTGKANTIAVMSSMPFAVSAGPSKLGFMMEIAATAAVAALESQLSLILVPPATSAHASTDNLEIDGALIIEPSADDPYLTSLTARGIPLVSVGHPGSGSEVPYVDLQLDLVTNAVLTHFSATGARHVALFVGQTDRASYHETEACYRQFAHTRGMPAIVRHLDERQGEAAGYQAAQDMLQTHPEVDALYVMVDTFASGAVQALTAAGMSVPQDIRIATRYDGIRARESTPRLTAFNLHLDDVARLALGRLLQAIKGEDGPSTLAGPSPNLVIRQSSAANAT
jgi:DNA-binding LacI/PurR family transcriptional regulator